MTLQEFIALWQAQPFRPFRLHSERGVFEVHFPLQIALTPAMRVALAIDGERVELFSLDELKRGEAMGEPVDLARLIGSLPPELVTRSADLLSAAVQEPSAESETTSLAPDKPDPGTVNFLTATEKDTGIYLVHVAVTTRAGERMFSTVGTRWNVHGVEPFENGTSIYLHHLDHPSLEQRVILWPPDKGTFESFAEAMSTGALQEELHRRDQQLSRQPASPPTVPKAYWKDIVPKFPLPGPDREAAARGEDPREEAERYPLSFSPADGEPRNVQRVVLDDTRTERPLFDLRSSDWHAEPGEQPWLVILRHPLAARQELRLVIDPPRHVASVEGVKQLLPLAFIERQLLNFVLYRQWAHLWTRLTTGPCQPREPEIIVPLPGGFRAELWPAEERHPLPFLQVHIVDGGGRTVFDLRATNWAALLRPHTDRAALDLIFISGRRDADTVVDLPVQLNLISHRVTCASLEGASTIGQLQAAVRRVSGAPWMHEELPRLLGKGRLLPSPPA